jgi:hypothetical protein
MSWLNFLYTLIYNQENNKAMIPSHITWKKKSHDTPTYNNLENKAMTPSHITRKKIVSWLYFLPGYM